MSWHAPLSDWDIQYILTRGEACARRFLCLACTSSEAELSVPHTMARGTALSCTWESRPLAFEEGVFGKKASPSCPRARRGAGFTESGSTPLHTATSCSGGRAARWVWEGWLLLTVWFGERWAQPVPVPEATAPMSHLGESEVREGWQHSSGCTAQLLPLAGRGWVPAAKLESKWKTMTYRKLCEARLVSEDHR